jgi:predicted DNA-binding protein YlxM (UPF0122 family)
MGKCNIRQLPQGLTKQQIAVLALSYYDGLSYAEIGRRYDVSGEAVGQMIKRALKILSNSGITLERPNVVRPSIHYVDPQLLDTRTIK